MRVFIELEDVRKAPKEIKDWILGSMAIEEPVHSDEVIEKTTKAAEKLEKPKKETAKKETKKEAPKEEEVDDLFGDEEPKAKPISLDDLNKRARELCKDVEVRAKVKEFLTKNRWEMMKDVPEDKRSEVLAEMEAYAAVAV
jgi:hypothetical protein